MAVKNISARASSQRKLLDRCLQCFLTHSGRSRAIFRTVKRHQRLAESQRASAAFSVSRGRILTTAVVPE